MIPLALALALAGCSEGDGSNPFDGETPTEPTDPGTGGFTIPEEVAGNVTEMSYDATAGTLTVSGVTQDEVPFQAVYTRQAALDSQYAGYQVFMAQNDALDRHATALVLESSGNRFTGQVRAGALATGGPRNRYFGGGYYERDGDYDAPAVTATSGMVSYVGRYAGLTNIGVRDYSEGILIEPDPSVPDELRPSRAAQVTGDVFLNADFADNSVEGNIYNRVLVPTSQTLPSLVMVSTDIDNDGAFSGDVEFDARQTDPFWSGMDNVVGTDIGDYAGIFAGTDSTSAGGAVRLEEFDGIDDRLGMESEQEYGVFVLERCGTAAASSALCNDVR
jgi:hypothetical protein